MRTYSKPRRTFPWLNWLFAITTIGTAFIFWGLPPLLENGSLQIHFSEGSH